MSTNQTNLTNDIKSFLSRTSKKGKPLKDSTILANNFLKDLPEYKENYAEEIIASQIDCILLTQII